MQVLLDHLNSVILMGGALVLLGSIFLMQSEAAVDVSERYALQSKQSSFVDQLEIDLANVGSGMGAGGTHIDTVATDLIAFFGVIDTVGTSGLITYSLKPTGMSEGIETYRIERRADATLTGGSSDFITSFAVSIQDAGGTVLPDSLKHQASAISVAVEWVAPFDRASEKQDLYRLQRSAWSTTVRPLGLR